MTRKIILLLLSSLSLQAMDTNKRKRKEDIDLPAPKKVRVEQASVVPMEDVADANNQATSSSSSNASPIISMLISQGSHKNAINVEENQLEASLAPLMQAVLVKNINAVKKLISIGVDVNEQDSQGRTALFIAAQDGHAQRIKILMQATNIDAYKADNDGMTPLAIAVENNHTEAVNEILEGSKKEGKRENIDLLDKKSQWTPLARAVRAGNTEIINLLLAAGANPTAYVKSDGEYVTVSRMYKGDDTEVVDLIKRKAQEFHGRGLEVIAALSRYDRFGCFSNDNYNPDKARKLLVSGIDVNATDSEQGAATIHWSAQDGQLNIVQMLLDDKADVNAKDNRDYTALHWAAHKRYKDIKNTVSLLINNKANVNAKGKDSRTPLHFAASDGSQEVIELLLGNKADINAEDKDSKTPLHDAACSLRWDIVNILKKAGAK